MRLYTGTVYNLRFFDLVNFYHLLIFGYLVHFQKLPWLEYYNNILQLYLPLGWLTPESILKVSDPWAFHYNHGLSGL